MTTACLENSSRGWLVTIAGYGATFSHVSTCGCVYIAFGAVNNALVLTVDLGEVWDVEKTRQHDAA